MTIGEFSKITKIKSSTLRYYEDKGLIFVDRDVNNRRVYSENDIEWVKFLQRLKNTGMTLKNMKLYSDFRYKGDETIKQRLDLLINHRKYVDEQMNLWEEYSNNLDKKISFYEDKLKKAKKYT